MKNFLHEWRMNRKIRRILAYNKKHPEQCFHFEDHLPKLDTPAGDLRAEAIFKLVRDLKSGGEAW